MAKTELQEPATARQQKVYQKAKQCQGGDDAGKALLEKGQIVGKYIMHYWDGEFKFYRGQVINDNGNGNFQVLYEDNDEADVILDDEPWYLLPHEDADAKVKQEGKSSVKARRLSAKEPKEGRKPARAPKAAKSAALPPPDAAAASHDEEEVPDAAAADAVAKAPRPPPIIYVEDATKEPVSPRGKRSHAEDAADRTEAESPLAAKRREVDAAGPEAMEIDPAGQLREGGRAGGAAEPAASNAAGARVNSGAETREKITSGEGYQIDHVMGPKPALDVFCLLPPGTNHQDVRVLCVQTPTQSSKLKIRWRKRKGEESQTGPASPTPQPEEVELKLGAVEVDMESLPAMDCILTPKGEMYLRLPLLTEGAQ